MRYIDVNPKFTRSFKLNVESLLVGLGPLIANMNSKCANLIMCGKLKNLVFSLREKQGGQFTLGPQPSCSKLRTLPGHEVTLNRHRFNELRFETCSREHHIISAFKVLSFGASEDLLILKSISSLAHGSFALRVSSGVK